METVITTDKLTKRFGSFVAASELSFEVHSGEIFAAHCEDCAKLAAANHLAVKDVQAIAVAAYSAQRTT